MKGKFAEIAGVDIYRFRKNEGAFWSYLAAARTVLGDEQGEAQDIEEKAIMTRINFGA